MYPSKKNWLLKLGLLLLCFLGVAGASTSSLSASESPFMHSFVVDGNPTNIVMESNERVWFTLPQENAIGTLFIDTNNNGTATKYNVPTLNSEPYDLVYDARGAIWFTERSGNKIARLDLVTKAFQEFPIPTANSMPTGITLDPSGNVWFGQQAGNKLGKFDPITESFTEYAFPEPNVKPEDVIYQGGGCSGYGAGAGCIWATSPDLNKIYFLQLDTLTFGERPTFDLQCNCYVEAPWHGTVDAEGILWITTRTGNRIGKFSPGTLGYWIWFAVPTADSGLTGLAFRQVGTSWHFFFTQSKSGMAGQLTVQATTKQRTIMREQPLPTANTTGKSVPSGVAVSPSGRVWIADSNNKRIITWNSPYFYDFYMVQIYKNPVVKNVR